MGGVVKKIKKVVKKIVKPITKVVKKVVKGIGKVAKKVWKGVKKVAKGIGKAVKKMGPLASIAIGFIPGFQALWANAGIWGAIGKGAITGFVTSGGKLKGALIGAAGGGLGYAANAGMSAYNKGVSALGENASITDKISAGFKSVGSSTTEGVSNMFKSASDAVSTGDMGNLNYLRQDMTTGEMVSVYDQKAGEFARMDGTSVMHGANKNYVESLEPKAQKFIADNRETFRDLTPKQMNQVFENQEVVHGYNTSTAPGSQLSKLEAYKGYVSNEQLLAEQGGYTYDPYTIDSPILPTAGEYQSAISNRALDAQSMYDKITGKPIKASMQDVDYRGPLAYTEIDTVTGEETYYKAGAKTPRTPKNKFDPTKIAKSLFGGSSDSDSAGLPFSTGDAGDQYNATGGLQAAGGEFGTGLGFADYYGGALDPRQYTEQQGRRFKSLLG